jgi:hypothetical protein
MIATSASDASARRPSVGVAASARAVADDVRDLVRAEVALAKAEVKAGAQAKAVGAAMLAAAGALAAVAALALLLALGFALAEVGGLPGWASALIVAALLLVAAGVLVAVGRKKLEEPISVETAKDSVREDVGWAKRSLQ